MHFSYSTFIFLMVIHDSVLVEIHLLSFMWWEKIRVNSKRWPPKSWGQRKGVNGREPKGTYRTYEYKKIDVTYYYQQIYIYITYVCKYVEVWIDIYIYMSICLYIYMIIYVNIINIYMPLGSIYNCWWRLSESWNKREFPKNKSGEWILLTPYE